MSNSPPPQATDRPRRSESDGTDIPGQGWRPSPIRQYVLKVYSRCNLACDYCYVYQMADQTWRDQPLGMSHDVLKLAAHRIVEHARQHSLPEVGVVFHGGEPLLAGPRFFADAARMFRQTLSPTAVTMTVQSNGVLLADPLLDELGAHDISVAVSLDGPAQSHDRHRRYPNGRGSHADVARGLDLLNSARYRRLFAGLLCTVDLEQDPVENYRALLRFTPPRLDYLLPLANWSTPPPGRTGSSAGATPYADWLGAVFDRWYSAPVQETELRLFREIIHLLLGGVSHADSIGLAPSSVAVIETDGSLEGTDALKSAYPGAAATGMHLATHSIDDMLAHPSMVARQSGLAALAEECLTCPVRDVCGGGFYPHRYRAGSGFRNPSVYCPDLLALIRHIRTRVRQDIGRLVEAPR